MPKTIIQETEFWPMLDWVIDNPRYCPGSPDGWNAADAGMRLTKDENDSAWAGENVLRIEANNGVFPTYPIRIWVSGKKLHDTPISGTWKIRVVFEFIIDGEEHSIFDGGWVYLYDKSLTESRQY